MSELEKALAWARFQTAETHAGRYALALYHRILELESLVEIDQLEAELEAENLDQQELPL